MRFVVTCRAWKVCFKRKKTTRKKGLLNWKERGKEKKLKITAGKSSIEKTSDKKRNVF
jgi:hypothetical protein